MVAERWPRGGDTGRGKGKGRKFEVDPGARADAAGKRGLEKLSPAREVFFAGRQIGTYNELTGDFNFSVDDVVETIALRVDEAERPVPILTTINNGGFMLDYGKTAIQRIIQYAKFTYQDTKLYLFYYL